MNQPKTPPPDATQQQGEFLDYLRKLVVEDLDRNEPRWRNGKCETHRKQVVAELTLSLLAMGWQNGDPESIAVLGATVPPLVPAYWADRIWPPPDPARVWDDVEAWILTRRALHD